MSSTISILLQQIEIQIGTYLFTRTMFVISVDSIMCALSILASAIAHILKTKLSVRMIGYLSIFNLTY